MIRIRQLQKVYRCEGEVIALENVNLHEKG